MDQQEPITMIQAYLRENARRQYKPVSISPFTLFFHPTDAIIYFNYAIPDSPVSGEQRKSLRLLCAEFQKRGRIPRFEFLEEYAPDLPAILENGGFKLNERQWTMVCTPGILKSVESEGNLDVIPLTAESPAADIRDYIIAQREGFNPDRSVHPTEEDISQARSDIRIGGWRPYLVRVDGESAAAATTGRIIFGVSEIAGIATRIPFRRRGIATYLTWLATQEAFNRGAHITCLTAASPDAGRIYEKVGYQPFATMLSYSQAQSYEHPIAS